MRSSAVALMVLSAALPAIASAQTIGLSTAQALSTICGAGLPDHVRRELHFRVGAALDAEAASGRHRTTIADAGEWLIPFWGQGETRALAAYGSCVEQTLANASDVALDSGIEPAEVALDMLSAPSTSGSAVAQGGDRFQMQAGESRALLEDGLIFSVVGFSADASRFDYRLTRLDEQRTDVRFAQGNEFITVAAGCTLLATEIHPRYSGAVATFVLNCRD